MTNVYQGERLGEYEQIGQTASGRKVYKQQNGDNFLYYLEEKGVINLIESLKYI